MQKKVKVTNFGTESRVKAISCIEITAVKCNGGFLVTVTDSREFQRHWLVLFFIVLVKTYTQEKLCRNIICRPPLPACLLHMALRYWAVYTCTTTTTTLSLESWPSPSLCHVNVIYFTCESLLGCVIFVATWSIRCTLIISLRKFFKKKGMTSSNLANWQIRHLSR